MKNKNLQLTINALGTNGEGIANTKEYTCFVPFCLPGEVVEATANYCKGKIVYADLVKIKKAQNGRRSPKCKVFGLCGGCQLQHMSYELQLQYKQNLVKNNLSKIGGINFDVLPTEPSAKQYGYRNKLQIPITKIGGKTAVGFYKSATHEIVPTPYCHLQEDWANKLCDIVCDFADENDLSVYDENKKTGLLRHIVARYAEGQLLATLVINGDCLPCWQKLDEKLKTVFDDYGLFVNINKKHTNVILGQQTIHLSGIKQIYGACCNIKYNLQPNSFFQVNDDVREKIYDDAISHTDCDCDIIIDAYSGIGILSGVLAKSGKQVFGIEIVKDAVEDADKLKKLNGLSNLTNICADVNIKLKQLCDAYKAKKISLVLDPPRKGLDKTTRDAILFALPQKIVYISCNSATLARDVKYLSQAYDLIYCKPYDMFPQTSNVETLVVLRKKS